MTYILPIRTHQPVTRELLAYLDAVCGSDQVAEVIVVDGSAPEMFADFEARRGALVRHVPVEPDLVALANGKVAGVLTGVRVASHERLVLADEDVRYDGAGLSALGRELDHADIVRPQNYFDPMPWHAYLDTARTLINRATGGDWPGTFGLRREALVRCGGYDGDVLFENLELVRTVRAAGGREVRPLDLFVRRLPPDTSRFWSQRVRQAYDEFARPARLLFWLSLLPGFGLIAVRAGGWGIAAAATVAMGVAEVGRRVGRGRQVFPFTATLAAPLWVFERAVCAWLAVSARIVHGGVPYAGRRLRRAATPQSTLIRRLATAPIDALSGGRGLGRAWTYTGSDD